HAHDHDHDLAANAGTNLNGPGAWSDRDAFAQEVRRLTNAARAKEGKAELAEDPTLKAVAKAHSEAMARQFDLELAKGLNVSEGLDEATQHDVGEGDMEGRIKAAAPTSTKGHKEAVSSGYARESINEGPWTIVPYSHSPSQAVRGWLTSKKG